MIGYGLVDPPCTTTSTTATTAWMSVVAVECIASAVTRVCFVGTDACTDECVLFGILWVLRALVTCKAGTLLTNDAVCEILNSAFRTIAPFQVASLKHLAKQCVSVPALIGVVVSLDSEYSASMKHLTSGEGRSTLLTLPPRGRREWQQPWSQPPKHCVCPGSEWSCIDSLHKT